jgi:hypothetical protein
VFTAHRQFVGQFGRGFLVWYGHVEAAPATREEFQHLRPEVFGGDVIQAVDERLVRLLGEQSVDERRPAMTDRMTDHTVLIRRVH